MCSCTLKKLFLIRFVVVSMCKFYGWICLQIVNRRVWHPAIPMHPSVRDKERGYGTDAIPS